MLDDDPNIRTPAPLFFASADQSSPELREALMGTQSGAARMGWIAGVVLVPLLYISTCSVISSGRSKGFANIRIGNTRQQVIVALGTPSLLENSGGAYFSKYGAKVCDAPCAERFWFENRLTLDSEAWSVEVDTSGKVIKKSHWVSP